MARNREFNHDEIIIKARDTFWIKGYHSTSIQDLVDNLGLGRGSIYNTFGNKHKLFLEVLDDYIDKRDAKLLSKLKKTPVKKAFEKYMLDTVEEIINDEDNYGCFIVNTMTELAASDEEVLTRLNRSETQLVKCYKEALDFGKENNDLTSEIDTYQLAVFISNTMKGLRVISKVNNSREELESIVKTTLTLFG